MFKTKLKHDGSLNRLKARVVAKEYHHIDEIDLTEAFSPIVKLGTIQMIITTTLVQE